MTRPAWHRLCLLLPLAAALSGCGTLARLFAGDAVDPIFKPEDRTTLVITDQDEGPDGPVLGDPSLSGLVSSTIMFHLKEESIVTQFAPPEKLAELQKKYGERFKTLADTQLAREAGAQQVLRVRVRAASVAGDPGVLRPQAVVYIWLADVATNQVIFPVPGTGNDAVAPEAQSGPYVLTVALSYKGAGDEANNALTANLRRALAQRIGRDVARVFFSYVPDSPNAE
jgi:hypothetical protein